MRYPLNTTEDLIQYWTRRGESAWSELEAYDVISNESLEELMEDPQGFATRVDFELDRIRNEIDQEEHDAEIE